MVIPPEGEERRAPCLEHVSDELVDRVPDALTDQLEQLVAARLERRVHEHVDIEDGSSQREHVRSLTRASARRRDVVSADEISQRVRAFLRARGGSCSRL
jgi:hypothetical protein